MPSKRQTRKSVSLKGLTYQRVIAYCKAHDRSVAGFIDELIQTRLDAEKWPKETVLRPTTAPESKPRSLLGPDGEFTF
jgi:hypothetical protein